MLDRYLLRYFMAVVDQGNFSRAAVGCNVSQPTLSVGIAKLERELGATLFIRSSQRVELTEAGTRFLVHARRIEQEFNRAMESMANSDILPSLRLGILSTVPFPIISQSIAASRPNQSTRFELIFGNERELVSHLAKGRIDVALTLVNRGADRFFERSIYSERYCLALPNTHPLAHELSISAEQLADEPMIVRRHCEALPQTSRYFTERGVRPHFSLRSTNDERVLQLVAAGLGITVVPQSFRLDGICLPRLAGFNLKRTIGWTYGHHSENLISDPPFIITQIQNDLSESIG